MTEEGSTPLDNPKWEIYAQKRCEGLSQRRAMLVAYPHREKWKSATQDRKAHDLDSKGNIKARITYLKEQAAKDAKLTRTKLLERLDNLADKSSKVVDAVYEKDSRINFNAADALIKATKELLAYARDDEEESDATIPAFDLSAHIAPTFCDVSRAIDNGATEITLAGGRSSAKSAYAYEKGLDLFLTHPNDMWMCIRQFANTLRRSCYANALWAIRLRGMTIGKPGDDTDFWATVSPMEITFPRTGQKILFTGLDDPEKLKSITFEDPEKKVGIVTFEEYSQFRDPRDVRNAKYSLLRGDHGWVFKIFNPPPDDQHWANLEAAECEASDDPSLFVHRSTWRDVPMEWLGKRFIEEAERMYRDNPEAAKNELDGETIALSGRVFPNVDDKEITDEDITGFKDIKNGLDWGFENDPFVFIRCAYDRKKKTIYIFDEVWAYHQRNEESAALVQEHLADKNEAGEPLHTSDGKPIIRHIPANQIRCDIAEKKSIADFRALGIDAVGAPKKVPVLDGIRWLKNRRNIVIDRKRCPYTYQEFVRYRAEEDPDGRFKGYPDKDNHSIDALRYAVFDLISDPECV